MNLEEKLAQEVITLFASKGKSVTPVICKVWVNILETYGQEAIDALAWACVQPDDFPTAGKIVEHVEAVRKEKKDAVWKYIGEYRKMFSNLYVHWNDAAYESAVKGLTDDAKKLWNDFNGKKYLQSEDRGGFMVTKFSDKLLEFSNTERGLTNV